MNPEVLAGMETVCTDYFPQAVAHYIGDPLVPIEEYPDEGKVLIPRQRTGEPARVVLSKLENINLVKRAVELGLVEADLEACRTLAKMAADSRVRPPPARSITRGASKAAAPYPSTQARRPTVELARRQNGASDDPSAMAMLFDTARSVPSMPSSPSLSTSTAQFLATSATSAASKTTPKATSTGRPKRRAAPKKRPAAVEDSDPIDAAVPPPSKARKGTRARRIAAASTTTSATSATSAPEPRAAGPGAAVIRQLPAIGDGDITIPYLPGQENWRPCPYAPPGQRNTEKYKAAVTEWINDRTKGFRAKENHATLMVNNFLRGKIYFRHPTSDLYNEDTCLDPELWPGYVDWGKTLIPEAVVYNRLTVEQREALFDWPDRDVWKVLFVIWMVEFCDVHTSVVFYRQCLRCQRGGWPCVIRHDMFTKQGDIKHNRTKQNGRESAACVCCRNSKATCSHAITEGLPEFVFGTKDMEDYWDKKITLDQLFKLRDKTSSGTGPYLPDDVPEGQDEAEDDAFIAYIKHSDKVVNFNSSKHPNQSKMYQSPPEPRTTITPPQREFIKVRQTRRNERAESLRGEEVKQEYKKVRLVQFIALRLREGTLTDPRYDWKGNERAINEALDDSLKRGVAPEPGEIGPYPELFAFWETGKPFPVDHDAPSDEPTPELSSSMSSTPMLPVVPTPESIPSGLDSGLPEPATDATAVSEATIGLGLSGMATSGDSTIGAAPTPKRKRDDEDEDLEVTEAPSSPAKRHRQAEGSSTEAAAQAQPQAALSSAAAGHGTTLGRTRSATRTLAPATGRSTRSTNRAAGGSGITLRISPTKAAIVQQKQMATQRHNSAPRETSPIAGSNKRRRESADL